MNTRILLALGALVVAVVLFVVLRPEDEGETAATVPTTTASSPATTAEATTETSDTSETSETTTPTAPAAVRVEVEVRDGGPVGGVQRREVERGERIVLVVRSDVADHVHVHGVDLLRDVAPGSPARLEFRPRAPGVIEVELEDRHLLLAEIEVRP